MAHRSHGRLHLALAASAVVAVLFVMAVFAVTSARGGEWQEMGQWARQTTAAYEARDFTRPVLWGDSVLGRAAEHYERAEAIAHAHSGVDHEQLNALLYSHVGDGEPLAASDERALRARWAPAVAAMRCGARCADARPRLDIRRCNSAPLASHLDARCIVNVAVVDASDHAAAGRGEAAVRTLLDAATYGGDYLSSPALIEQILGAILIATVAECAGRPELLAMLDGEACAELEQGMELLAARLEPSARFRMDYEALMQANWALNNPEQLTMHLSLRSTWRYGFSRQAVALEAITACRAVERELRRPDAPRAFHDRRQWLAELVRLYPAHSPLHFGWHFAAAERFWRRSLAHVQLLRTALAFLRGAAPTLIDPFSELPIAVTENVDGTVTFSSVGGKPGAPIEFVIDRGR